MCLSNCSNDGEPGVCLSNISNDGEPGVCLSNYSNISEQSVYLSVAVVIMPPPSVMGEVYCFPRYKLIERVFFFKSNFWPKTEIFSKNSEA